MIIGHYMASIWGNGGVATYIRRISAAQKRAGHTLVYFDGAPGPHPGEEAAGPTRHVRDEAELFEAAARSGLDILHAHSALSLGGVAAQELPIVRTVHGHQPFCPSATRFLKRPGAPCDRNYGVAGCVWGHIIDRCGSARPRHLLADFERTWNEMRSLRGLPVIVATSHFMKRQMTRAGYDPGAIHVLHLPAPDVETDAPPPEEGSPRFLFLGRITPLKGLDWLLRALGEAAKRTPLQLDVAGEGYEERELRGLAAQLGLGDRATFHGWVDAERVRQLVLGARAVVFPSLWHEPAGLVTLDAAANGRAVIGSRVGGLPEYAVEGENALLVEPGDVSGLARAIERLAGDAPLARRLGETGRRLARERFALGDHQDALMGLYDQARCRPAAARAAVENGCRS